MTWSKRPDSLLREIIHPRARWWIKILRTGFLTALGFAATNAIVGLVADGRPMTPGERADIATVFKQSADYSKMRLHRSAAMDVRLLIGGADAEAFGNVVAFRRSAYRDDFSVAGGYPLDRFVFRHEAAHVWQHQSCIPLKLQGLSNGFRRIVLREDFMNIYAYKLDDKKDLLDYNVEQQASMIADYMGIKEGSLPLMSAPGAVMPEKADYEKVLGRLLADPSYAAKKFCR